MRERGCLKLIASQPVVYASVLLTRPDILYAEPFPFAHLPPTPSTLFVPFGDDHNNGINDQLAVGSHIYWQSCFIRINQRHCRHPREQAHRHTTRDTVAPVSSVCFRLCDMLCGHLTPNDTGQRTPRARYEPRARRNLAENLAGTSPETRVIFRRRHVYPPVHLTHAVLVQEMRMRRRPACLPSQRQLPAATGSAG